MTSARKIEPPFRIAVVGGAQASEIEWKLALDLGRQLAGLGALVVCGGGGGVMEAVAQGATEAGGLVIGILPGSDPKSANPWIGIPLATGMGEARNALVVQGAEAVISVGGEWGTLSEIALASKIGLSVGILGTPPAEGLGLRMLEGSVEAAGWALERAQAFRGS